MKCNAVVAMAALCLGCGVEAPELERLPPQAASGGQVFKIGVLVAAASPAATNFAAAADLAESQLNQGLQSAGSSHRFDVVVASYAAGQAASVAIDWINNQGVTAIVADTDDSAATVNALNYDFVPQIAHKFPVDCYQCSSPRFNDVGDTQLGYADPEGWLFRTFFNANFESAVQTRLVLNRSHGGDFNGDGRLKIVVYYDSDHQQQAFNFPAYLDSLNQGTHSVELVLHGLAPGQPPTPDELAEIFDDNQGPDGNPPDGFPDAVVLILDAASVPPTLSAYNAHPAPRPPVQAGDEVRRDFLLPSLLASGGATLEGSSVLRVSDSASGPLFTSAFKQVTGKQPEVTAAFLYDAIVEHAGAIGWAFHFGSTDPQVILGNYPNVNDPTGKLIRPRPADFKTAAQRINQDQPINYDGAGSSLDMDFLGENFPDLVHWKIQGGKFVEVERYRCNPDLPTCARR